MKAPYLNWKAFLLVTALGLVLAGISMESDAQNPIIKKGSCPIGYRAQGKYCVPRETTKAPNVIEKKGKCPIGWRKSGKYCIQRGT